jgi:hypothetical protein
MQLMIPPFNSWILLISGRNPRLAAWYFISFSTYDNDMRNKKGEYSAAFFAGQQDGSYRSAKTILPIIFDLISPKAVIDAG